MSNEEKSHQSESAVDEQLVMAGLLEWAGRPLPGDIATWADEVLEQTGRLLGADHLLLTLEDEEEPWLQIFIRTAERTLSERISQPDPETRSGEGKSVFRWKSLLDLSSGIRARVTDERGLIIPFRSDTVRGQVLLPGISSDGAAALAASMVPVIVARFGAVVANQRRRTGELSAELNRIARDLHDGLLQSFTGIVLQLETAHQIVAENPDRARELITQSQAALMNEQRDLRAYLERLRPKRREREIAFDFHRRLEELVQKFHRQWGVEVSFDTFDLNPLVSRLIGWETHQIILEAMTNAVRHGDAKTIHARMATIGDRLEIKITDHGRGFPFHGRMHLRELNERGLAPSSLSERVTQLNGEMTIDSSEEGSSIEVSIPMGWSPR